MYVRVIPIGVLAVCIPLHSWAAQFAVQVVDYDPGLIQAPDETDPPLYDDPTSTLGSPDGLSGETGQNPFGTMFPNVLSPFSPAFEADEIVEIGPGGQLTIRLAHKLQVGSGLDLGVFSNAGLMGNFDPTTFEFYGATDPAEAFGAESAAVEVSADGATWLALNNGDPILFDMPTNFYNNAGVFESAPPANPMLADFGQSLPPGLAPFDGATEAEVLAALGGSAGGTWLDLSPTGLDEVSFVRFRVPMDLWPVDPFNAGELDLVVFELDAVAIANGKVGAPTPEPTTAFLFASAGVVLAVACRRCSQSR